MILKKIISDSPKYPLQNIKRVMVLYILFLMSFLVIPAIFAFGYLLRIIEGSIKDSDELPAFNGLWGLFIDGIKFSAVNLIYFIVPSIILFILIGIFLTHFTSYLVAYLIVYLFFFIIGFFALVFTVVLSNMAYEQCFAEALRFKKLPHIIKGIGRQNYFNYITLFLIVEALGGLIFLLRSLGLTSLILSLILVFLFTYVALFWARFAGLVCRIF